VSFKEVLQSVNRRHLGSGFLQDLTCAFTEQIETLKKQGALILECPVKATAADIHGLDQVADGCGLIAFAPEEQQGFVYGLLVIEFRGACHAAYYGTIIPKLQHRVEEMTDVGLDQD
jgi:hypothetical protein